MLVWLIPARWSVADRHELTLVLLAERPTRPAAGDEPVQLGLKRLARPGIGLTNLVEPPEGLLPAHLFALHAAQRRAQLVVLPVHRAEHETYFVEHTGRQGAHPELAGRDLRVL